MVVRNKIYMNTGISDNEHPTHMPVREGAEVTFRYDGQLVTIIIDSCWISDKNLFTGRFVKAKKISSPPPRR